MDQHQNRSGMDQHQNRRLERCEFAGNNKGSSGSQRRSHITLLQPGQEFDVEIGEIGHKGDGLVKIEGYTIFVKNTEKGEKVRIRLKKVMDTIAFADRI